MRSGPGLTTRQLAKITPGLECSPAVGPGRVVLSMRKPATLPELQLRKDSKWVATRPSAVQTKPQGIPVDPATDTLAKHAHAPANLVCGDRIRCGPCLCGHC